MRFLVLTNRRVGSGQSGYDLRVANLCAHLPGEVHLVVAPHAQTGTATGRPLRDVFASVEELEPLRTERRPWGRHLRLSNDRYLASTRPAALAAGRARLAQIVRERAITHVLVFGGEIAELVADLSAAHKLAPPIPAPRSGTGPLVLPGSVHAPMIVLDVCDSAMLTAQRAQPAADGDLGTSALRRLAHGLDVARKSRTEGRFLDRFDLVTAINDADARAVEGRWRGHAVATVPNGLSESYVGPLRASGSRRGIAFWGNLAFEPNREALRFLVDEVFLPHLRGLGVELCVVGAGAPHWLTELAAREPSIRLTGYVDDLAATVTRYPVMVNPMRSGSGLKNKVLEAFGLGLAVVSTSIGAEALPEVRAAHGNYLVRADAATAFAQGVITLLGEPPLREQLRTAAHDLVAANYRWDHVGRSWARLVAGEHAAPAAHPSALRAREQYSRL